MIAYVFAAVSLSDVLAIIAVVVSFGAAFATVYFQYFERRRVAVVPGDWMDLSYGQIAEGGGYSELDTILSLSVVNRGAIDTLVTEITATVRPERDGARIQCRWGAVYEPVEELAADNTRRRYWKLKGWAQPFAAPGRTVVTNWFRLYSPPIPSALAVGLYVLEIEATETRPAGRRWRRARGDTERRVLARWTGGFGLDEKGAGYLQSDCVEGRESLTVTLRPRASGWIGPSTGRASLTSRDD